MTKDEKLFFAALANGVARLLYLQNDHSHFARDLEQKAFELRRAAIEGEE